LTKWIVALSLEVKKKKRRMKLNESKSVHTDFTNNKIRQQPVFISGTQVPYANTAKCLAMTLYAKSQWKEYIKKECYELSIKLRKMTWGFHSRNYEECRLLGCDAAWLL
jgi:hypothetical protein